ncbi:MAG: 50S ribosomal protein L18 [Nanoarchaeota archaeon]|nr:50S ribosomal protein L18 [Nanoarchaeota archaeon]
MDWYKKMNVRKKTLQLRRKREGRTDYNKRLSLLKSGLPRLVIRKSLRNVRAQIVEYHPDGDKVLLTVDTHHLLKSYGLKKLRCNSSTAYLVGLLIGKKALVKKITQAVLDIGLQRPVKNGVVFAALKGAVDAGMQIPYGEDILPDEKRIKGEHLKDSEFEQVKARVMKE